MKRICLFVIGLYIKMAGSFAQPVDTNYQLRKLKLDEVNFISSYYVQDGNNSAVTGGIGTEKLKDYSNTFDVKLVRTNRHQRKEEFNINLGIDYYTSASSDNINPATISSASHEDLRIYPSVTRTVKDENKNMSFISNLSFSNESDYQSYGAAAGIVKGSKNKSSEFSLKVQLYLDWVEIILPVELRNGSTGGLYGAPNEHDYPWKHRNTFSSSLTYSKIINKRLQLMALLDLTLQRGFLSLPFHRIYFRDHELTTEKLPSSRFKIPVALRANYFLGDHIVLRGLYRFYDDNWGMVAHTADLEASYKMTPFFSVVPFYRYYTQAAASYFAAYNQHNETEKYYTSNYDLSRFDSHYYGAGFRLAPYKGLLGHRHWQMIEMRYGHYKRSNGLHADIISLNLKYK